MALELLLDRPWLEVRLPGEHEVTSWAVVGGGRRRARVVAWREVHDRDLPPGVDPARLLGAELRARGLEGTVGLLTSLPLHRYVRAGAAGEGVEAEVVATVGLGNAVRVGAPARARVGTINVLARLSCPLSEAAALEALTIAAEARTAAVLEAGLPVAGGAATGTGTDCIVVAAPPGEAPAMYAGKHTAIGQTLGAAVLDAIRRGVEAWRARQ